LSNEEVMDRGSCLIFESGEVIDKGPVQLYRTRIVEERRGDSKKQRGVVHIDACKRLPGMARDETREVPVENEYTLTDSARPRKINRGAHIENG
jgi:hypothetical protein